MLKENQYSSWNEMYLTQPPSKSMLMPCVCSCNDSSPVKDTLGANYRYKIGPLDRAVIIADLCSAFDDDDTEDCGIAAFCLRV